MGKFLGEGIKEEVVAQMTARSKFLSQGKNKLPDYNLNAPYVALYSSVTGNGIADSTKFYLAGGNGFSKTDSFPNAPFGYSAYTEDKSRGFTPRPGITDVKVKSKGTYGSLRDVEVSIKAFNLNDFQIIYDLYCRPGFSFLLEFGHSVYINNSAGIQATKQTASGAFLAPGAKHKQVIDAIRQARKDSHYNYDGMVGICKNFNWTLNTDGSYDISVSLISKGEVIESIKVAFDPGIHESSASALAEGFKDKTERKSPLHFLGKRLELNGAQANIGQAVADALHAPEFAKNLDPDKLEAWCADGFDIKGTGFFDTTIKFSYISLRTVCEVIKGASIMYESEDSAQQAFRLNTNFGNKYLTHPLHCSVNPFVCVIPNNSANYNNLFESKPAGVELHSAITSYFTGKGVQDDVLAICVSSLYLYEKLDAIFDDDQESENESGLLDVFKSILGGINEALGGINELDLAYDEDENEWSIVDRKNKITGEALKNTPKIDLVGLGSFATQLKTESKITNKLASQMSIAAQASGTGTKQNVAELLLWNRGHKDRIFPVKKETKAAPANNEDGAAQAAVKAFGEFKDRVAEAFEQFNGTGWFTDQVYDPDMFKGLVSGHQKYQSQWVTDYLKTNSAPPPGTIPVEVGFTLLGIGGFRIAEAFQFTETTNKLLPSPYTNGDIGFIITKVDHSITDSGWTTEVGALMYNLKKLSGGGASSAAASAVGGTKMEQVKPVPVQNPPLPPGAPGSGGPAEEELRKQGQLGTNVSYDKVQAAMKAKGYYFGTKELELNIIGVRNTSGRQPIKDGVNHPITNRFSDILIVAYVEKGVKIAESFQATTVPGSGWTMQTSKYWNTYVNYIDKATGKPKTRLNANGTGAMAEGQFLNQYVTGRHHSHASAPYFALISQKGSKNHRDNNYKDNWMTMLNSPTNTTPGLYSDGGGMNIHHSGAGAASPSKEIGIYSAGCQVFANQAQQIHLMELVVKSQKATKATSFNYTLINDKEIKL